MTAYYNEYDPFAAEWLRNLINAGHLPAGDVDSRSILEVQPEDLNGYDQCHFFAGIGIWGYGLRRVGWPDDRPIWSGSCPCQPFSAAGRGLGFADERHLWPAWYHLVTQRRPARIVGEQVASKDGLEWFDLVSTDLENAGYAVGSADLCAAGFAEQGRDGGGFHLRQRQYFVAVDGMADPRGERRRTGWNGDNRGHDGPQLAANGAHGNGLEYAGHERRGETGSGRPDAGKRLVGASELGGVEYPDLQHQRPTRRLPTGPADAYGASEDGELADSERRRPEMASVERGNNGTSQGRGEAGVARGDGHAGDGSERLHGVPDNDARRPNANLVYCRDGRWRPVEPGAFPLAYAVPRSMGAMRPELRAVCLAAGFGERDLAAARKYRAGALKAFGNALDGETVVAFLEAALECVP